VVPTRPRHSRRVLRRCVPADLQIKTTDATARFPPVEEASLIFNRGSFVRNECLVANPPTAPAQLVLELERSPPVARQIRPRKFACEPQFCPIDDLSVKFFKSEHRAAACAPASNAVDIEELLEDFSSAFVL
jgi:hypothetical protein